MPRSTLLLLGMLCGAVRLLAAEVEPAWSAPTAQGVRVGASVPLPKLVSVDAAGNATIAKWRASVGRSPGNAFAWRQLADACVAAGQYPAAVEAFRREAALYRQRGDVNAAKIEEDKADGWDAKVVVYRRDFVHGAHRPAAKFEPAYGCYFGANVESDPRVRGDYAQFAKLTGREHSMFFDYAHYGQSFPSAWAQKLKAAGAAMQLAWEPNGGLGAVKDDAYLQKFAADAAASGIPIFLRFACEMNGDWTAWSGSPSRYIAAWRVVAGVMRRVAPNVALVWAPNALPERNIPDFYPGDEWVDWVGINGYSVHHHDNDLKRPALREDASDLVAYIYRTYADRKPIMICETAATHFCKACGQQVSGFGADKLAQLYSALPRRYPRVKAICWYDINNLENAGARSERRSNNFSLTDDETILNAYRRLVSGGWFLSKVITEGVQSEALRWLALSDGTRVTGRMRLTAWVRAFVDRPTVVWRLDGVGQGASDARPYDLEWDPARLSPGAHTLEALVTVDGKVVARQSIKLNLQL